MPSSKKEIRTGQSIRNFHNCRSDQVMSTYSFESISINGREIKLVHILQGTTVSLSGFEASTFLFIRKWFGDDDDFIQKTSGSTGTAKSISISRHQMIASAKLTAKALELKAGENSLLCLDPEYIAGKMMLVRSFITGMKIIATEPSSNPFHNLSHEMQIDFTAIVPLQLNEILQSDYVDRLHSVRNILVGGAAIDPGIKKKLSKFNSHIYATYGMTETISHIALQRVNGPFPSENFDVLPGIEIDVDDRGCLEIDVPYLPEKIVTNDLVEIKPSGHFKWLGRVDNIINTGGIKVIPEKIEDQIRGFFEQQNIGNKFLISSRHDALLGNKIILLIEGELKGISKETLKSNLKKILPLYEAPKEIHTNIRIVQTENGKINRSETSRQIGNWRVNDA
jgi:o-succinylbenzoate---CoA ligase